MESLIDTLKVKDPVSKYEFRIGIKKNNVNKPSKINFINENIDVEKVKEKLKSHHTSIIERSNIDILNKVKNQKLQEIDEDEDKSQNNKNFSNIEIYILHYNTICLSLFCIL